MKKFHFNLYLEINDSKYIFFVEKSDGENYFEIDYKLEVPLEGIINNRIANFEKSYNIIKENIYLLEEKFKCTFKELILILENLSPSFLNLSGYKKLNGSQISKENIIYILNTCKSIVNETEFKKKFYTFLIQNIILIIKKLKIYLSDCLEIFIHMNYLLYLLIRMIIKI